MKQRLLWFVMCVTAVTGYHRTIGIPRARTLWHEEVDCDDCKERILHGMQSLRGMSPFFGGLIIMLVSGATSMCGSTLLTSTKLVTAAHCWDDGEEYAGAVLVVLGSVRLFSGGTRIATNQVDTHYAYNSRTVENDIAMITIPEVTFSAYIKPISLPEGALLQNTYEGRYARVVGYGKTSEFTEIAVTQSLGYAVVAVVNKRECDVYGKYFRSASMICSNPIVGSPCGGDSGGPLFVRGAAPSQQYLIGIVSYGSKAGCDDDHPVVYTRVSYYIDWIKARI